MKFLLVVALAIACSARPEYGVRKTYLPPGSSGSVYYESSSYDSPSYYRIPSTYYDEGIVRGHYVSDYQNHYDEGNVVLNEGSTRTNVHTKTNIHHVDGPSEVTRNTYFYDAGDDDIISQTKIHVPVAPTKKNINVVFVKAPRYGHNTHIVAPQQQSEEKTKVVVLVKKPEADQHITIPALPPPKPSKPEVTFVKYDNQHEAEAKISASLSGARNVENLANNLGSEAGLLSSIARNSHKHEVGVTVDKYVNDASEAQYQSGGSSQSEVVSSSVRGLSSGSSGYSTIVSGEPIQARKTVTTVIKDLGAATHNEDAVKTIIRNYEAPSYNRETVRTVIKDLGVPAHDRETVKTIVNNYDVPSYNRETVRTVIKDLGVPTHDRDTVRTVVKNYEDSSYSRPVVRTVVKDYGLPAFNRANVRSIVRHVNGVPITVYASDSSSVHHSEDHPGYTYKK